MKKWISLLLAVILLLTGCSAASSAPAKTETTPARNQEADITDLLLGIWMAEGADMADSYHFYEDSISMSRLTLGTYAVNQNGDVLIIPESGDSIKLKYTLTDGQLNLYDGDIPLVQVAAPSGDTLSAEPAEEPAVPATEPDDPELEPVYQEAARLLAEGEYRESMNLYQQLGDYKDSRQRFGDFLSAPGKMSGQFQYLGKIESCQMEFFYDSNGSLVSAWQNNVDPYYQRTYTLVNDDQGNCIKLSYLDNDGDTGYELFEYDSNGNLITQVEKYTTSKYQYDEFGNRIRCDLISDGELWASVCYEYDSQGNMTREYGLYSDGEIFSDITRGYDERGLLVYEVLEDEDDSDRFTSEFLYDEAGRLLKYTRRFPDGTANIDEYTYDENGDLIKQVNRFGDSLYIYSYSDYQVYYRPGKDNSQLEYIQEWVDSL